MQHGIKTKYHLLDPGFFYTEWKWMRHHWTRKGHTRFSITLHWMKRKFARDERHRGKQEVRNFILYYD